MNDKCFGSIHPAVFVSEPGKKYRVNFKLPKQFEKLVTGPTTPRSYLFSIGYPISDIEQIMLDKETVNYLTILIELIREEKQGKIVPGSQDAFMLEYVVSAWPSYFGEPLNYKAIKS